MAPVLKTGESQDSVGSNPTPSAFLPSPAPGSCGSGSLGALSLLAQFLQTLQ